MRSFCFFYTTMLFETFLDIYGKQQLISNFAVGLLFNMLDYSNRVIFHNSVLRTEK